MRLLTVLAVFFSIAAAAGTDADTVARKSRYYFAVRSGMAMCSDCEFDGPATGYLTTIHGIHLTPATRVGLGIGLTAAGEHLLVPVFGSLSADLVGKDYKKKNRLFVEFNYGIAGSPGKSPDIEGWTERVVPQAYIQPSIGYKIKYHDLNIGIMAGIQSVRLKRVFTSSSESWAWGMLRQGTPNSSELNYNVTRFTLGLSIGWRD